MTGEPHWRARRHPRLFCLRWRKARAKGAGRRALIGAARWPMKAFNVAWHTAISFHTPPAGRNRPFFRFTPRLRSSAKTSRAAQTVWRRTRPRKRVSPASNPGASAGVFAMTPSMRGREEHRRRRHRVSFGKQFVDSGQAAPSAVELAVHPFRCARFSPVSDRPSVTVRVATPYELKIVFAAGTLRRVRHTFKRPPPIRPLSLGQNHELYAWQPVA